VTVLILSWAEYGTIGRGAALSTLLILVLAACILPAQWLARPPAERRVGLDVGEGTARRALSPRGAAEVVINVLDIPGVRRMPRFGVCAWIYGAAPLMQPWRVLPSAGYDGVEIPGSRALRSRRGPPVACAAWSSLLSA